MASDMLTALRYRAAAAGTGCTSVSIEELNVVLHEQQEEIDGDTWMQQSKAAQACGVCPCCFATDEASHEKGCYIAELEQEVERLRAALKRIKQWTTANRFDHSMCVVTLDMIRDEAAHTAAGEGEG